MHPTAVGENEIRADGWLLCDGQAIYSMRDFALRLVPKDS